MLFSSFSFLFFFLPLVLATYYLVDRKFHNFVLLFFSLAFYAWGEPLYLSIMLSIILWNYFAAILVERSNKHRMFLVTIGILGNLSVLFYFKYTDFVLAKSGFLSSLFPKWQSVIMPIGISFFTFQSISYLIDTYRRNNNPQHDLLKLSLYVSLFPQLIAGPIVKYRDICGEIESRKESFSDFSHGLKRFIFGLAKKVLLANTMGAVADSVFNKPADEFTSGTAWIGVMAYAMQIFYDFSGYSDMAIGLGRMFGFHFLENFNYPYISKSITDLWHRWHISLSTWFKTYLYIPLGGNRCGRTRTCLNLFIVFAATGFWHGAEWSFLIWGIWHGLFIIIEKITGWNKLEKGSLFSLLQRAVTLFIIIIGWVMFRAENLTYAWAYIKNMLGLLETKNVTHSIEFYYNYSDISVFAICVLLSMPLFRNIIDRNNIYIRILVNAWTLVLLYLSIAVLAASTYNPFIYFRF